MLSYLLRAILQAVVVGLLVWLGGIISIPLFWTVVLAALLGPLAYDWLVVNRGTSIPTEATYWGRMLASVVFVVAMFYLLPNLGIVFLPFAGAAVAAIIVTLLLDGMLSTYGEVPSGAVTH